MGPVSYTHLDVYKRQELEGALSSMKNRKVDGLGGIHSYLLKYNSTLLKFRLLHLLNMRWKRCMIVHEWIVAKVFSVFKRGDRTVSTN